MIDPPPRPAPRPTLAQRVRAFVGALRAVPIRYLLRGAVLVAIVAAGVLLLRWPPVAQQLTEENITAILGSLRGLWYTPLLLVAAFAVIAPTGMPISPLVIGGGAVFGSLWGSVINMTGLFLGAAVGYSVARALGRDAVAHLAGERLRRAERVFERRGFWPLVQTRFLPIPFALINFGAALAGVRLPKFLSATALGLLPTTVMHTYFSSRLAAAASDQRLAIGIAWLVTWIVLAALSTLPTWRDRARRRQRYRELLARRAARR